jgi:hypothetical protein
MASRYTKPSPNKPCWLIEGYKSTTRTYVAIPPANLSNGEITTILQRLLSRHLSEDEIIGASLRKPRRIEIRRCSGRAAESI